MRWNRRCLSQIECSELTAETLGSLQRLSAEHNVNDKTDIFALVGNFMLKGVHINKHACFV